MYRKINNLNDLAIQKMELRYKVRDCTRRLQDDYEDRNDMVDWFFLGFKGMKWLIHKLKS